LRIPDIDAPVKMRPGLQGKGEQQCDNNDTHLSTFEETFHSD